MATCNVILRQLSFESTLINNNILHSIIILVFASNKAYYTVSL